MAVRKARRSEAPSGKKAAKRASASSGGAGAEAGAGAAAGAGDGARTEAEAGPARGSTAAKGRSRKTASRKTASRSTAAPREAAVTNGPETPAVEQGAPGVHEPALPFPVVGIGTSAGGLQALEKFFAHASATAGIAYVVVQHLDPSQKAALVPLLQRHCPMPVEQVKDGTRVEPDRVYVIPPNKDLSLHDGVLRLLPPTTRAGLHLPIDFFFRTLAAGQKERSIGVVLSGMGSDGTLGLRAIKETAGAAFVESPESAGYDAMPRSVIDAGLADVVAPASELAERIAGYAARTPFLKREAGPPEERAQGGLEKVLLLLKAHTGNDFTLYKRSTIQRRIERRMGLHQFERTPDYVRYLRENPREIDLLFKELLIGVTSFFRDTPAWDALRDDVLPAMAQSRPSSLRAWVPGCSTGEEAYSLAMALTEAAEQTGRSLTFQIFATDLDRDAIERARHGVYPATIAADVAPERLRRFFVQDERGFKVRKEIREAVVFAPQNVISDPPFTRIDILSCRNLLIYLSPELQKRLIPMFHYSLNAEGVLFLGSAETVGSHSGLFHPLDGKSRLYRKIGSSSAGAQVEFSSSLFTAPAPADAEPRADAEVFRVSPPNLQSIADRLIVQRFAPAAVITNDKGDILYISGRTGKYLEPAAGKATLNLFAMAREGLRYELSAAFSAAQREDRPVITRAVKVRSEGGATHTVDVTVQRIGEPKELRGTVIVVLDDVPAPAGPEPTRRARRGAADARLAELERALQEAREEVQTTHEEMQTSQEELKSTNEELQSTNEELQSTNEELTTSKEEMQSMNEELQTVNHELQAKVDELSRANNDMKNLLNSTEVATLFLDGELRVRRFTTPTAKLIKLIPTDAGRPVTDIATDLEYPGLADDAHDVLRTLVFKERHVRARDQRWFAVRIMPYRTLENVIDGVVITFTDATAVKALEATLREQASQFRQITESLPILVWGARPDGGCDYINRRFIDYTGASEAEQLGFGWLEQVHPGEREAARAGWKAAIRSATPWEAELRLRGADGGYRWFTLRAAPILDERDRIVRWCGTCTDIDGLKRAKEAESPTGA